MSYVPWAFLPYCSHHSMLRVYCEIYATSCAKLRQRNPPNQLCDHLEGWDREGGRETQEGGDMGIYVYI